MTKKIKGHRKVDDVASYEMYWKDQAACVDEDLSLFFAAPKSSNTTIAISICQSCPVRQECFYEGMIYGYDGIWGGSTYDQRRALAINFLNYDLGNLTKKLSSKLLSIVDLIGKTRTTAISSLQDIKTHTMEQHVQ